MKKTSIGYFPGFFVDNCYTLSVIRRCVLVGYLPEWFTFCSLHMVLFDKMEHAPAGAGPLFFGWGEKKCRAGLKTARQVAVQRRKTALFFELPAVFIDRHENDDAGSDQNEKLAETDAFACSKQQVTQYAP